MRRARAALSLPALGLIALCALGPAAPAARAQTHTPAQRIDENTGPCSSLALAAGGPAALAIAWVAEGTTPTLYLRERANLLWTAPAALPAAGSAPRDVVLAYDAAGRLHLVWTALAPEGRVVLHAQRPAPGAPFVVNVLPAADDSAQTPGDHAPAADYPVLEPDAQGGVLVAWQESRPLQFSVHAARVAADGSVVPLGRISNPRVSGMTPSILGTQPPQIAWYELQPIGGELRLDVWSDKDARWRPSGAERMLNLFPDNNQVMLRPGFGGVVGVWPGQTSEGIGSLNVGRAVMGTPERAASPVPMLDQDVRRDPPGDHGSPSLSGKLPGRLTACWQAFTQERQSVVISSFFRAGEAPQTIELSPATQRFAALPTHATQDDWSAAAWTNDAQDGGDGGVYLSEIVWQSPTVQD